MGSFHWSKHRKSRKSTTTNIRFREWAMKNFSDDPSTKIQDHNLQEQVLIQEKSRCEWNFNLKSVVSSTSINAAGVSDALGVIEFDPSDTLIATGGIARKIRIYTAKSLLPNTQNDIVSLNHANVCDFYICTPAKLSSLRWKPGSESRVIASADYDGVVMEYDLERRIPIFERDEHGGRRVWSVDYSKSEHLIGASGSDDGTMQIWDPRNEAGGCVATVEPSGGKVPVCCVEFNPYGGSMIAVGCADRKAYVYDLRMMVRPLLVLDGHGKTVTYVRFVDGFTLATAGIDGCLKLWNLSDSKMVRSYKGHANTRSFVGLSVWRNGGLLGCGSENNRVFVYDKRWGEPIWVHECEPVESVDKHVFVSSVCWSQVGADKFSLVAGGSDGTLQVFQGSRKNE
ncbi:Transducin/WD40 repeat-like superfamily protein [Euphorbia peplus]|nr:Transducin/WD40 repeat-like superfamily protein [Euphorbia peplus]